MSKSAGPYLFGLLIGLMAAGMVWLLIAEPRGEPITLQAPPSPAPLRIHVAGAVVSPGVYVLPAGSIVQQAIEAAGGPASDSSTDALNMAAPLQDGQRIYLPSEEETDEAAITVTADPLTERLNINTATAPEFELLPGIGPVLAQKIVEFRESHGPFGSVEEMLDVPGIGPAKLEQIRDLIRVE